MRRDTPRPDRRALIAGAAASLAATPAFAADGLAAIEASVGGRLGVFALDAASGATIRHRADERFPMCSTFKAMAAAAALKRIEAGEIRLDTFVRYGAADLFEYAPVTRAHVANGGMPFGDLLAAAVELSDNTAANLILKEIGGPAGWTGFVRSLGDRTSRLDRNEPDLNTATPGDPRDTTTPAAMAGDLGAVLLDLPPLLFRIPWSLAHTHVVVESQPALASASRDALIGWMVACKTGDKRLGAGLPSSWRIADKTGTGDHGSTNDIAVAWTASGPIVVACYLTEADRATPGAREAAIAAVGKLVAKTFRPHG